MQLEKYKSLLAGDAKKLALKKTHVPPAPMSIFRHGDGDGGTGSTVAAGADAEDVTGLHDQPFRRLLGKDKRAVHKPMLDQSWYGSLHDAHLQ